MCSPVSFRKISVCVSHGCGMMWRQKSTKKLAVQQHHPVFFFGSGSIEAWCVDEMDTGSFLMIPIITIGMVMVFMEALKTSWTTSSKVCRPSNMRHWDLADTGGETSVRCTAAIFWLVEVVSVCVVFLAVSCRCSWTLSLVFDSCLCRFPLDLS